MTTLVQGTRRRTRAVAVESRGAQACDITIYTIVKGFRPSPILDDSRYREGREGSLSPAAAAP